MKKICTLFLIIFCVHASAQVAPTVPASNLAFSNIEGAGFQISFTKGNGSSRIVVLKEGSAVTGLPEDGKEYTANASFGTAVTAFTGAGEYVVLKTTSAASVTVDKLKPGTLYYAAIYEYNGTGASAKYLMVPLTGNMSTVSAPTVQTNSVAFPEITGNSVKMNWANGNGSARMILARKAAAVNTEPTDLQSYIPVIQGEYGTGNVINMDNYTIYKSNGSNVTVTKLEPNTTYHFAFFEFNGFATPVYLKPANTWSVTTNAGPTKPTQTISFSAIEGNRITVGCTIGNGSKRLLIAGKTPITAMPVNGTAYSSSAVYGSGSEIAPGQYVISNSSAQSAIVTGLDPNTTYYFRYFEFDENSTGYTYYLSTPLDGNKSTAIPPTVVATNFNTSNITGSSATVSFTPGNGSYRLVVLKEGSAVNAVPQDLMVYSGNNNFGSGTQITTGNYSIVGGTNGSSFIVNGLKAGYTYHVGVFEFNGANYPVYNKTAGVHNFQIPLEPAQAATAFTIFSKDGDRMRIGWTNGTGAKRLVIVKKGAPVTYKPADGTLYTANTTFTQGTQVATDEYAAYDGNSNYFDLTNLETGTTYYFAVYEYNLSDGGVPDYLTTSVLTGAAATVARPTVSTTSMSATGIQQSQATINYTAGNGAGRIFVMHANTPVDALPQDLTYYSSYNASFGTVQFVSAGNYIVNRTTAAATPFTVTNLAPNTTYYVSAFEYNGSTYPVYLAPGSSFSFTTADVAGATVPTIASSDPLFTNIEGNKLTFSWTNGDGASRIVVAKQGSAVTFVPNNATTYTANAALSTGTDLGNQQYVVYNGNGNTVTVSNLLPATTYYFTVFEYNGSGTLVRYLTSSTLPTSFATLSAPAISSTNAVVTTTGNSMTLNWTNGSGNGRLVVVKKGSAVTGVPVNLSVYPANAVFQNGAQIAAGEYVVYAGNSNSVTVTALTPGETYYYAVFEYNGNTGPVYNTTTTLNGFAASGTLPLTWLYFTAEKNNGVVVLNWATTAETNTDYFVVEKSSDGIEFRECGRVKAAGHSSAEQRYRFSDPTAESTMRFYRLRQTDIDGLFSYSKTISLQVNGAAAAVSIQPNPVHDMLRVTLPAGSRPAGLLIHNAAGILVYGQAVLNQQPVNIQQLPAGIYYITIQQGEKTTVTKVLKQ